MAPVFFTPGTVCIVAIMESNREDGQPELPPDREAFIVITCTESNPGSTAFTIRKLWIKSPAPVSNTTERATSATISTLRKLVRRSDREAAELREFIFFARSVRRLPNEGTNPRNPAQRSTIAKV